MHSDPRERESEREREREITKGIREIKNAQMGNEPQLVAGHKDNQANGVNWTRDGGE